MTPFLVWLGSRLLIGVALVVGHQFLPSRWHFDSIWQVVMSWDGIWYHEIATVGYQDFLPGQPAAVAFFPLFPLITRAVMALGLPFAIAGCLVNNLAFLATLWVVHDWVKQQHGERAAGWAVAWLAFCPLALFTALTYTEGLFLLVSTLALRAFDRKQYGWAMLWGGLTTATRLPGIMLVPAFLLASWLQRRGAIAYLTTLVTASGLLLYMGYCALRFGDPLVFLRVMPAFGRPGMGFNGWQWAKIFIVGLLGPVEWDPVRLKNPLAPLQVGAIFAAGWFLGWRGNFLPTRLLPWLGTALVLGYWLLWGDGFVKATLILGGGWLLWWQRRSLSPVLTLYGAFSLLLILFAGSPVSSDRYAYGIVSLSIAVGLLLDRFPRWGVPVLTLVAIILVGFSLRFAQLRWVA